ncbi:hypothetical protein KJ780_02950 [Candidatus Micrarchaeota archaeon]|nr:hypothetical protein [Candidatus Micrarchaeota archaeon]
MVINRIKYILAVFLLIIGIIFIGFFSQRCTDSDGDMQLEDSYYVKGATTTNFLFVFPMKAIDTCDGEVLTEFYCKDSNIQKTEYMCPYGCEEGACVLGLCGNGNCDIGENNGNCPEDCEASVELDIFSYLCGDPDGPYPDLYRNNVYPYNPNESIEKYCNSEPWTDDPKALFESGDKKEINNVQANARIFLPGDLGYGIVNGNVVDNKGNVLEGVDVYMVKGKPLYPVTKTDAKGEFSLTLPVASPRGIVFAEKKGYLSNSVGNIDLIDNREKNVTITLLLENITKAHIYSERLIVSTIQVIDIYNQSENEILPLNYSAVLDPSLYPENVKIYLQSDELLNYKDPLVQEAIQEIWDSVPETQRKNQTEVVKAAYAWKAKNVYRETWQMSGEASAANSLGNWGTSWKEWMFSASEAIKYKRGICLDSEIVMTALLRGLEIPARQTPTLPSHPVTQWWVQLPNGSGYWANLQASKATMYYVLNHENFYGAIPSEPENMLGMIPIDGRDLPIPADYMVDNPTWSLEIMQQVYVNKDSKSNASINQLMQAFEKDGPDANYFGEIPSYGCRENGCYYVKSFGMELDLVNLGDQEIIDFTIPLLNNPIHNVCDLDKENFMNCSSIWGNNGTVAKVWTNHPEWLAESIIETEYNPITNLTMKIVKVRMNVSQMCASDKNCASDRICEKGVCEISDSVNEKLYCGDNICDEHEGKFQNCPQDCEITEYRQ